MNTANFDFSGANVLVTGGTSGIGNAIAHIRSPTREPT